ncbi:MAG: pyrroloquinoline quinone biosynthesis peptide chaperone PqqD [Vulcanimicrobiaceae bacterium]
MIAAATRLRLAPGIRLREQTLFVPEGLVDLSPSAAAVLALVDGTRSAGEIAEALAARFADPNGRLRADVAALLEDFSLRGFVVRA